jgi:hypothetical protein
MLEARPDPVDSRGPGVFYAVAAGLDADDWYAACTASGMSTMLTVPGLTLLFLSVVIGLGATFVWMLWEIEQASKPRRNSDRFG